MPGQITYIFPRGEVERAMQGHAKAVAKAATAAMRDVVDEAVSGARANIAAAGFGSRWQKGMQGVVFPKKGDSLRPVGLIFNKLNFAGIFETGGAIKGKPLLWLPIEATVGKRMTPKKFIAQGGKLRSVKNAKGRPLLVAKNISGKSVPVFFGISTVSLRKRFNIVPIIRRAASRLGEFYFQHLKT